MTALKTIAKLLKLKGMKVTGLSFHRGGIVKIAVKPYKNGCRCPECGRRGRIVRQRPRLRQWCDLPVGGRSVFLLYAPREINCVIHGRVE